MSEFNIGDIVNIWVKRDLTVIGEVLFISNITSTFNEQDCRVIYEIKIISSEHESIKKGAILFFDDFHIIGLNNSYVQPLKSPFLAKCMEFKNESHKKHMDLISDTNKALKEIEQKEKNQSKDFIYIEDKDVIIPKKFLQDSPIEINEIILLNNKESTTFKKGFVVSSYKT